MNIHSALITAKDYLKTSPTARLDCEILLVDTLQVSQTVLHTWPDRDLTEDQTQCYFEKIKRREQGEPIAYIIGEKEFWNFTLTVNTATLIPRPETELLVDKALEIIPQNATWKILDLGTGSGAIALAIASERPHCEILATDISKEALKVAAANCVRLNLKNVKFKQSNWFSEIDSRFNLIISNPPYIAAADSHLKAKALQCEPVSALASGEDGLASIRAIIEHSGRCLVENGSFIVEHGYDQQLAVIELLTEGDFSQIKGYTDLNELPRCVVAKKSAN